jgi:hypothetical protein
VPSPDSAEPRYPALYQVGRGKNQVADPAYVWNNTANDTTFNIVADPGQVEANRDFFTSAKPGYTPYQYPHPLSGPRAPTNVRIVQ